MWPRGHNPRSKSKALLQKMLLRPQEKLCIHQRHVSARDATVRSHAVEADVRAEVHGVRVREEALRRVHEDDARGEFDFADGELKFAEAVP